MNVFIVSQGSTQDSSDRIKVLVYTALTDAALAEIAQWAYDNAGIESGVTVDIDLQSIDENICQVSFSWPMTVFSTCFHPSPKVVGRTTRYCRTESVVECFEDIETLKAYRN